MELKEALEVVVNEAQGGLADYAKSYAQAALDLGGSDEVELSQAQVNDYGVLTVERKKTGKMMVGKEMKVQLLYVLSNLGSWRGERAREVKAVLKEAAK